MTGNRRTVVLTERRPAVRRLPRADADDLARYFRHVVDVTPTFDRGVYRLTARGYVGTFRTATVRWVVRPKLPWESLGWLGGVHAGTGSSRADDATAAETLADLLGTRLAALIRERADAGLLRDYTEREAEETAVRGRINIPRQLRTSHAPSLFHLVADEFSPDVVWNRLPKAAARRLLDRPGLAPETRLKLEHALAALADVSDIPPSQADQARLVYDSRTEVYRPLIAFSRLILGDTQADGTLDGTALLLNLEHLFQQYVFAGLSRPGVMRPDWSVDSQATVVLVACGHPNTLTMRPDLLARNPDGQPESVWDVKWKPLTTNGPHPADVHQALGYAAALGVPAAGLVYPGRRFSQFRYTTPGSAVRLHVVRLAVVGSTSGRERSIDRLSRLVQNRARSEPEA